MVWGTVVVFFDGFVGGGENPEFVKLAFYVFELWRSFFLKQIKEINKFSMFTSLKTFGSLFMDWEVYELLIDLFVKGAQL